MKVFTGYFLISISLTFILVSYVGSYPYLHATPGPLGALPLFALWIWMFIDFAKRKDINNKVLWGFFLFFFGWIAAIIYFFIIFKKSEKEFPKVEKFKIDNPKTFIILKFSMLALILTISQLWLTSLLYITFGFPSNSLYEFVVYKVIYLPHSLFLKAFYSIANINPNSEPSFGIGLLVTMSDVIYTCFLYLIALLSYHRIKGYKCRNQTI